VKVGNSNEYLINISINLDKERLVDMHLNVKDNFIEQIFNLRKEKRIYQKKYIQNGNYK